MFFPADLAILVRFRGCGGNYRFGCQSSRVRQGVPVRLSIDAGTVISISRRWYGNKYQVGILREHGNKHQGWGTPWSWGISSMVSIYRREGSSVLVTCAGVLWAVGEHVCVGPKHVRFSVQEVGKSQKRKPDHGLGVRRW